jgi:hypothetical protein
MLVMAFAVDLVDGVETELESMVRKGADCTRRSLGKVGISSWTDFRGNVNGIGVSIGG